MSDNGETKAVSKESKHKGKTCFIITPIGPDKSEIRRHTDGVITSVLKPLLTEVLGFDKVEAAHDIAHSGSINTQVMNAVIDSDLVIANLTSLNPNVMYELAVRHATQKPIIHLCAKDGTKLPFDIVDQRTIFYSNDMLGVDELKNSLLNFLSGIVYDMKLTDNPIYNSRKKLLVYNELEKSKDADPILKYLVGKIDSIENNISHANTTYSNRYPSHFNSEHEEEEEGHLVKFQLDILEDFNENKFMNEMVEVFEESQLEFVSGEIVDVSENEHGIIASVRVRVFSPGTHFDASYVEDALKKMMFTKFNIISLDGQRMPKNV